MYIYIYNEQELAAEGMKKAAKIGAESLLQGGRVSALACVYTYACACACACACKYVCMYVCMCVCMCMCKNRGQLPAPRRLCG